MSQCSSPLPRNTILVGDVLHRLRQLPSASVHCAITSPPYWAQRDYGHDGQIGMEQTVSEWADTIAQVCAELGRVLRPDGSLWLNLGDGFSRHPREGTAKKSLLLGPERVALQLTQAGWLLRNKVIWAKRNSLPSSVGDRLSTKYELVYFLTRQPHYFFDLDAIREPALTAIHSGRSSQSDYPPRTAVPSLGGGMSPRMDLNQGLDRMKAAGRESHLLGKNPGDVWLTSTASYRGAHFATFPVELIRRPLLSTCPERACASCGMPWRRIEQVVNGRGLRVGPLRPSCQCQADWVRGVVLDPFMGSGTVAVAAEQFGRDWLGIELSPVYAALAEERLAQSRAQRQPPAAEQKPA